jgi:hypothetical protein
MARRGSSPSVDVGQRASGPAMSLLTAVLRKSVIDKAPLSAAAAPELISDKSRMTVTRSADVVPTLPVPQQRRC